MRVSGDIQRVYRRYRDTAEFVYVYIREAHPTDGWSVKGWSCIDDPTTFDERLAAARDSRKTAGFPFDCVVDAMDDATAVRYAAWPNRIFVVDTQGKIAYAGEQGPAGFWVTDSHIPKRRTGTSLAGYLSTLKPAPTADATLIKDIAYGPHERNKLDLYLVKSDKPTPLAIYIHGGGYRAGDKSTISYDNLKGFTEAGLSVAALNYRYSTTAPYPAPMLDCAMALQFLRLNAAKYNADPDRFGAWGGSAGAGISMWLGYHDDLAKPNADSELERQSTRVKVVGCISGQPSLDPRVWNEMFQKDLPTVDFFEYETLHDLFGVTTETARTPEALLRYTDASMITHLTADDPPVYAGYSQRDVPVKNQNEAIHHPAHGRLLMAAYDRLKLPYVLKIANDQGWKDGAKVEVGELPSIFDYFASLLAEDEADKAGPAQR